MIKFIPFLELLLCSARAKARKVAKIQILKSKELRKFKRRTLVSILHLFLTWTNSILALLCYILSVAIICFADIFILKAEIYLDFWTIESTTSIQNFYTRANEIFLTMQIAIVAIVAPFTVALVSILLQQSEQSTLRIRMAAYFQSAHVLGTISSSFLLAIILLTFQFFPVLSYFPLLNNMTLIQLSLTILHFIWLIRNVVAIWNLVSVSIRVVNPYRQQHVIQEFVAHNSIPQQLEDQITSDYCRDPESYECSSFRKKSTKERRNYEILVGRLAASEGVLAVEKKFEKDVVLYDIRFTLIRLAVFLWRRRIKKHLKSTLKCDNVQKLSLIFPLEIGQPAGDLAQVCRLVGNCPLCWFERGLIKWGFVFRGE